MTETSRGFVHRVRHRFQRKDRVDQLTFVWKPTCCTRGVVKGGPNFPGCEPDGKLGQAYGIVGVVAGVGSFDHLVPQVMLCGDGHGTSGCLNCRLILRTCHFFSRELAATRHEQTEPAAGVATDPRGHAVTQTQRGTDLQGIGQQSRVECDQWWIPYPDASALTVPVLMGGEQLESATTLLLRLLGCGIASTVQFVASGLGRGEEAGVGTSLAGLVMLAWRLG